jgi:hypothetical protein
MGELLGSFAASARSAIEKPEEFVDALGAVGVFGGFQDAKMAFQGVGLLLNESIDLRHDLEVVSHERRSNEP